MVVHSPLQRLRKLLTSNNIDAILISSVPNITYMTTYSNFSIEKHEAYVVITKTNQYILTDARYLEAVRTLQDFTICEITATTPVTTILQTILTSDHASSLGFEEHNLTVAEYNRLISLPIRLKPIQLTTLRSIKTEKEIATIEKACALGDKTFKHLLPLIKEGVTEKQLATEIELFMKRHGADISFKPIVAFGPNAAIPHHHTSDTKLTKDTFVLLDFGTKVENYCSDMTRTIFFGTPTTEQQKMYQTVYDAQQKAIDFLTKIYASGNTALGTDVDAIARDHIISQGYPNLPHSLGHGIGLEVHEAPRLSPNSKNVLKEGMVFSIEPGIYLPGFGGVRIEDLITINPNDITMLTNSPKEFIQIS